MLRALAFLLLLPIQARAKDLARDPVLFHSGTRAHLDEDIKAGTIPQMAWDDFVMGKTNFDLPAYRKGLYGAEALSGTSLYSLYATLAGDSAWVMRIHVKPECVTKDAVFSEEYSVSDDPAKGGRFSRWYHLRRDQYRALEKDCLTAGFWEEGSQYDASQADPETKRLTNLCTPVLADFLDTTGVKLVFDTVNDNSWYLRDRSCIASLSGSPDELFDAILDGKVGDERDDFVTSFYGDGVQPGTFFSGNTLLFLAVTAETARLKPAALPLLSKLDQTLTSAINGDKRPSAKLRLDNNGDNLVLLRLAVRAVKQNIQRGSTATLQATLTAFLEEARTRLAKDCDGKHGVRQEKRASCDAATGALSRKLVHGLTGR